MAHQNMIESTAVSILSVMVPMTHLHLQPEYFPDNALGALHQSYQHHHIEDSFPDILPAHGDNGEGCINHRRPAGHKGGENEAGQDNHSALQAHTDIAFQKGFPGEAGALPGEGRQWDRSQGGVEVQTEKAAIDGQDQDKGHDCDK